MWCLVWFSKERNIPLILKPSQQNQKQQVLQNRKTGIQVPALLKNTLYKVVPPKRYKLVYKPH